MWTVGVEPAAVGFLDESELIRMAISPDHADDRALAEAISADFTGDLSELLPAGTGIVEVDGVDDRINVEAAAFPGSSLTVERWSSIAAGHAYRQARFLVGYSTDGAAVAVATYRAAGMSILGEVRDFCRP